MNLKPTDNFFDSYIFSIIMVAAKVNVIIIILNKIGTEDNTNLLF